MPRPCPRLCVDCSISSLLSSPISQPRSLLPGPHSSFQLHGQKFPLASPHFCFCSRTDCPIIGIVLSLSYHWNHSPMTGSDGCTRHFSNDHLGVSSEIYSPSARAHAGSGARTAGYSCVFVVCQPCHLCRLQPGTTSHLSTGPSTCHLTPHRTGR